MTQCGHRMVRRCSVMKYLLNHIKKFDLIMFAFSNLFMLLFNPGLYSNLDGSSYATEPLTSFFTIMPQYLVASETQNGSINIDVVNEELIVDLSSQYSCEKSKFVQPRDIPGRCQNWTRESSSL